VALAQACLGGQLAMQPVLLLSDQPDAPALARAQALDVPAHVVCRRDYPPGPQGKAEFEQAMAQAIDQSGADWIALAGFMRVLTPAFVEQFSRRLVNIHPSLLPDFPGLDTHARALERFQQTGIDEHGATVHFVTADLDAGPVIAQARLRIQPEDTAETLSARVLALEHQLYPTALASLIKAS